eukprot:9949900-Heterocapsa_arctica.AAC.1
MENTVNKYIKEDQVDVIRQIQLKVAFRDHMFRFRSWQDICCRTTAKNEEESKDTVKVFSPNQNFGQQEHAEENPHELEGRKPAEKDTCRQEHPVRQEEQTAADAAE